MRAQNSWFRSVLIFFAISLVSSVVGAAQPAPRTLSSQALLQAAESHPGPQLPCDKDPIPPFPALADSPVIKAWSEAEIGGDWGPPVCTGWTATGFTSLVTTAARFRYTDDAAALLQHVGAISSLVGTRYWSTTHKRWQVLISDAGALNQADPGSRRADFTLEELKEGKTLYFEQVDNLSGKGLYQLKVVKASGHRIIFEIENVSTIRRMLVPIFHPGEMQSIYFLERESDGVWRYYSMVRTGKNANRLITRNESSLINRTVALYRYFAGIPSDQEPPAAR
ncbi:MAG TPA: DUF6675 family protein [Candidatus Saccharimonadales bacterium]|nr:DUF6675 family protein [Candidatus Saccharimonadales bacterium]